MQRLRRVCKEYDSYKSKYSVINYKHQHSAITNYMREMKFALAITFRAQRLK